MYSFDQKIVLVTGATRGIGKQIARTFAEHGAHVMLCGTHQELLAENAAEFERNGLTAECFRCDVRNHADVEEMANKILDKHKTIDILVNNAGVTRDNLLLRMKETDWDDVIAINLKGVFNTTKVISRFMLKQKYGRIINISSIIGLMGNIGQANYAASKAGIIGLTKSLAKEFASRGITVNAIAPGYIETEMTQKINDKTRELILKNIPLQRFGTPTDVAHLCLFLASAQAAYLTGQTICIDGGMAV